MAAMDVHQRDDLAFPRSLPEFQQLFPDDAACAAYLGRARWPNGFVCPHCGLIAEPFRIVTRPGVLECRAGRRQAGLLVGTVMERSHTPLSVWFWAAYLVASQTPGMSAVQFSRDLDVQYKTAFVLAHKLREALSAETANDTLEGEVEIDGAYFGGVVRPANRIEDRVDRRMKENQSDRRRVVIALRERAGRTLTFIRHREAEGVE